MDDRTVQYFGGEAKAAPWWKNANKLVLGIGAVATAVGAVIAVVQIVHPSDKEDYAQFLDVKVKTSVPYSEFRQRSQPPRPLSRGLAPVLVAATETPSAPTPITPYTPASPASSTPSWPSRTPSPSSSVRGPRIPQQSVNANTTGTLKPIGSRPDGSGEADKACQQEELRNCPKAAIYINPLKPDGSTYKPGELVVAYQQLIKGSRTVKTPSSGKKEMLGVVITVNIELSGLRGKRVLLSWTFWRGDGGGQLYRDWLNQNYAFEIVPGTDHDSASMNHWIPLPKKKGPYFIQSNLTMNGQTLVTHNTDPIR